MLNNNKKISNFSESEIIAKISSWQNSANTKIITAIGDDAAVIRHSKNTILSSDYLIEGNDFSFKWHNPYFLGKKAVITNISDISAMGATTTGVLVNLALPQDFYLSDLKLLYSGMLDALAEHTEGANILGGDLSTSDRLHISITAVGENAHPTINYLSDAKIGDTVSVIGNLGLASLGYEILAKKYEYPTWHKFDDFYKNLNDLEKQAVTEQLCPSSPNKIIISQSHKVHALTDISDGLVKECYHMANKSKVNIMLDNDFSINYLAPENNCLYGGEDHAFLFSHNENITINNAQKIGKITKSSSSSYEVIYKNKILTEKGWDSLHANW